MTDQHQRRQAGHAAKKGTRYYTHNGDTIAVRTATTLNWNISDHHATPGLTLDAATLATAKQRTLPYGEKRGSTGSTWPAALKRGFVGGNDDATGLTHLGAREYDPAIGRFVSVDPLLDVADPQQFSGYGYAGNNPITDSDPNGLCRYRDGDLCISTGEAQTGKIVTNGSGRDVTSGDRGWRPRPPGPTPHPEPWGDGLPLPKECAGIWIGSTCASPNSPQFRAANFENGSNQLALTYANWFGDGDCELGAYQVVCYVGAPFTDQPMTVGDILLYPGDRAALKRQLDQEAYVREQMATTCDKHGRCLDPNVFGPDLLVHEAAHSEQWAKYSTVDTFVAAYGVETANSLYLCGDRGACNKFEIAANPFKGGYWAPPTVGSNGEFQAGPGTPAVDVAERIMSR